MDYDVFPNVLDYEGPGGMVLMRQPIAAFRLPIGEKFRLMMGVEQPYSDIQWLEGDDWIVNPGSGIITTPGVGRNVQDMPDFTANVRYAGDYGHLQVAGILRKLTYQPAAGNSALDEFGYGINLTGTFHPWACLHGTPRSGDDATPMSKSRFLGQFAAGRGINRYIQDVNGLGLDATFDPVNGFRAIPADGWFVAYEQWWAKRWASDFTYGQNASDLTDSLPGSTYERVRLRVRQPHLAAGRAHGGRHGIPLRVPQEQGRAEGRRLSHPDGVPVQVLTSPTEPSSGIARGSPARSPLDTATASRPLPRSSSRSGMQTARPGCRPSARDWRSPALSRGLAGSARER